MRKIEELMVAAAQNHKSFSLSNTCVVADPKFYCCDVYLHGNHIASVSCLTHKVDVNRETLARWPSVTTKSRLRALGVNLTQVKGKIYIDGEFICEAR